LASGIRIDRETIRRRTGRAFVKKLPSGQWQITPTTTMNKRRKILTLAALAAFGLIIFFHYCDPWFHQGQLEFGAGGAWHGGRYYAGSIHPLIADVQMPLFALAVVYAGLFFLFGGKDTDSVPRRPRDWRRVKRVILIISVIAAGFVVIGGFSAAVIQSNEYQRQQERARKAYIEDEASKHYITASEIDLIDLRLGRPWYGGSIFNLTARIRNRAAHNRTLNSITLIVTIREKEGSPDILGVQTVQIRVEVPPHQTRAINETIFFPHLPELTHYAWSYGVSEIRGSKGGSWLDDPIVKDFDPDKYLGLTPTPSPKP
jgi:hypothetical protein